jgi:predicted transcriptional regulator
MRQKQKLTAAQLAFASGTSHTNVCAYERGDKNPSSQTLERLLLAIGAASESPIYQHNLLTIPAAALELRAAAKNGAKLATRLRVVRELVSNREFISSSRDKAILFSLLHLPRMTEDGTSYWQV